MNTVITKLLESVLNPVTQKSIVKENRLVGIKELENGSVEVKYNRDNIPTLVKRELEDSMCKVLSAICSPDKLIIVSVSSEQEEIHLAAEKSINAKESNGPKPQANIKVGHGSIGNKVRVAGVKKLLAVASGKGGVGKSTFSVNFSLALKQLGYKVGILDADIYGPSIPMLLNKREEKPLAGANKKILPVSSYGLKFISFGLFSGENDPVIWRGPMLGGVINQFLFDVDWGDLDFLILDLPPGTGDVQLSMVQNSEVDGAIVISTPQDVALLDAKKGLHMFRKVNVPVVGMVENMSYFICDQCDKKHYIFGDGGVEIAAKELGVSFLGGVPFNKDLRVGSDKGTPYMADLGNEGSDVWNAYMEIAKKVK